MKLDPLKYSLLRIVEIAEKQWGRAELTSFDRRIKDLYKELHSEGLITLIRTNKHWYANLTEDGKKYLEYFRKNIKSIEEIDLEILEDKKRFVKGVKAGLWILLVGRHGIGKTYLLEELMKTGKYIFVMGSSAKKEYILLIKNFAKRFGFGILVDELDKMHMTVQDALLDVYYDSVQVIATANDKRKIQPHIYSRFDLVIDINMSYEVYKRLLEKNGVSLPEGKVRELYESGVDIRKVVRLYRADLLD